MIQKIDMDNIMNALMIRHWGIFLIDDAYRKAPRYFKVENSIFDQVNADTATVIAIAIPYRLRLSHKKPADHFGKVEPFAWEFDYHKEVKDRLMGIINAYQSLANTVLEGVQYCVDHSPYNDREVAFHAGLGRIGINHLLINESLGSQFFIGYVVIPKTIELQADSIVRRNDLPSELIHPYCENCKKCVKACPTSVCGNGENNMVACLSSLTQTKMVIDETFRLLMSETIYGCSICQNVCPLNGVAITNYIFEPLKSNWIDLFELLHIDQKTFRIKYGHMGFAWRNLWVYQRNALIVLGNSASANVLSELKKSSALLENVKLKDYYSWAMRQLNR